MKIMTNAKVRRKIDFEESLKTLVAEPTCGGPVLYARLTMRSEIQAISHVLDRLMDMIRISHCVPGDIQKVEIALREALANAVFHGNRQDTQKKVHISCRLRPGTNLSIMIKDEGSGFDPQRIPDPTASENILADTGRGILLMKAFMDLVLFDQGGTRVCLQKGFKPALAHRGADSNGMASEFDWVKRFERD